MMILLRILLPVFGLIAFGAGLRKIGFLDRAMENAFNRFCYFIALPVFIFSKAAQSPVLNADAVKTSLALLLVTLALMVCAWLTVRLIRLPMRSRGTFIQAAFRGNLAYTGLPVVAYALAGESDMLRNQAEALAILSIAPTVFVFNLLGVLVLEWDRRHEHSGHPLRSCVNSTLRNPLIISCVLGFGWNVLALPFPDLFSKVADPLAGCAFPLALMAIGARIAGLTPGRELFPAVVLGLVKTGGGLLLGYGVSQLLDLQGIHRLVLMVLSACPTAVASYVLVDQLDGDRDLAASCIAVSTFLSIFALAAALLIAL